ncbi:hypothetical protein MWH25_07965 [Natroniella acetigena]|uniref:tyrosine-protein phosphatase n=1 Tax=Natroniella acetigena TaxID=52004 RepID=UPI00200A6555|nr:hypothetical protein [Natroniella acetigena]
MIDLHTHILPKADDGPDDLAEAVEIAKESERQGVKKIIATPHYVEGEYQFGPDEIKKRVVALQEELARAGVELEVLVGSEVYLTADLGKKVRDGLVTPLNGSRYLLVEFPMRKLPSFVDEVLYDLQVLGFTPVIAHPERYHDVMEDPNLLYRWVKDGALAQLNAGSLLGKFGSRVQETAEILVEHDLVQLLGSDLHSNGYRCQCLQGGMAKLCELIGVSRAERYQANAELVVADEEVVVEPKRYEKEQGFWGRLKKAVYG